MSKPNRWHPCFLPDNYRERLKQYLTDCERGIEKRQVGSMSNECQVVGGDQTTEAEELES